jgi:hypothetical protein
MVRGPHVGCWARSSRMRASTSGPIWWGQDPGIVEPSTRPAKPLVAYRRNQRWRVWRVTPIPAATAVTDAPSLSTSSTAR